MSESPEATRHAARLLTAEEVAEIIGMTKEYVWALCRRDEIPHRRFGKTLRFRAEAIDEWIRAYERGTLATSKEMAGRRGHAPGPAKEG